MLHIPNLNAVEAPAKFRKTVSDAPNTFTKVGAFKLNGSKAFRTMIAGFVALSLTLEARVDMALTAFPYC